MTEAGFVWKRTKTSNGYQGLRLALTEPPTHHWQEV
jgi:hypothetical protein